METLKHTRIELETTDYCVFANVFNDAPHTRTLAAYVESKFEDVKMCLVFGLSEEQVKERQELIVKAVNAYPLLLDALKDLIDYLGEDWKDDEQVKKAKQAIEQAEKQ